MGKWFFIVAVCDVFIHSRNFDKAFCQAGEANLQDYAPAQNVFLFLLTTYYYFCEVDVRTDGLVQQPIDSRLFVVILVNLKNVDVFY